MFFDVEELFRLVSRLDAVLVDVRYNPHSTGWLANYNKDYLSKVLGAQYEHISQLGNRGYYSHTIDIVDLDVGLIRTKHFLKRNNVILICAEKDYKNCHRKVIADSAKKKFGCKVIHIVRKRKRSR